VGNHDAHPGTGKGYGASKRQDQKSGFNEQAPSPLILFQA
jgi:hypothetical protein